MARHYEVCHRSVCASDVAFENYETRLPRRAKKSFLLFAKGAHAKASFCHSHVEHADSQNSGVDHSSETYVCVALCVKEVGPIVGEEKSRRTLRCVAQATEEDGILNAGAVLPARGFKGALTPHCCS